MNRAEKEQLVGSLKESLKTKEFMAVMKNHGLTVQDMTDLRRKVRDLESAGCKVAKNTLMKLVVKGTEMEKLDASFEGATAFAYSDDYVGLSRVLVGFAKNNKKLAVEAACLQGKLLNKQDIVDLSELPTYKEAMAQVVSMLQAPAMEMHRVIDQMSQQQENKGE